METRLIFPVTVAVAVHAALLFGVRWPHDIAGNVRIVAPGPARQFFPVDIRDEPAPVDEERTAKPKGNLTEPRPSADEDVMRPDPGDITQLPQPRMPWAKTKLGVIEPGSVGTPDGIEGATEWGPGSVIGAGELDRPPRTRLQVAPIYPPEARREGRTAEVVVEFSVDEQGAVYGARVVRATDGMFEAATLRAVAKWRFEPGRKNGRAVRFRMLVPVTFALNE